MKNILIVDDEYAVREVTVAYLERKMKDYSFFQAENAEEGLDLVETMGKGFFNLIITDVVMPGKNGIEFIGKLREIGVFAPIIVISGYFEEKYVWNAHDRGASSFLQKPFDYEDLVRATRVALSKDNTGFVHLERANDGSQKSSILTPDGNVLEAVVRRDEDDKKEDEKNWVCFSPQTDCALKKGDQCIFCHTWYEGHRKGGGIIRNATVSEMEEEITKGMAYYGLKKGDKVHVGGTGKGDATLNPDFYRLIESSPDSRSFRIATPGIVVPYRDYIDVENPLEYFIDRTEGNKKMRVFQLSFLAADDEVRRRLVGVAKYIKNRVLMDKYILRYADENKGILIYLNCPMIKGRNDSPRCAQQLAEFAKDYPVIIRITDLMPWGNLEPSDPEDIKIFTDILSEEGAEWVRFTPKGDKITGCGMLGTRIHRRLQ